MSEKTKPGKPFVELHRELVPLAEAAAAAYHVITQQPQPLRDPADLEEVRALVAVALATVAPILRQDNGSAVPLSGAEIHDALYRSVAPSRAAAVDYSALFIRRGDLLKAIEVLKDAHASFGRSDTLDALKRTPPGLVPQA